MRLKATSSTVQNLSCGVAQYQIDLMQHLSLYGHYTFTLTSFKSLFSHRMAQSPDLFGAAGSENRPWEQK